MPPDPEDINTILFLGENMTNPLINSMRTGTARTANGAVTHPTTLNPLVDLVGLIGASRGRDISSSFFRAVGNDPDAALKILFYARDIRGGLGERNTFISLFSQLAQTNPNNIKHLVPLIPEYGRFKDLLSLFGTPLEYEALCTIRNALNERNGLCAKWMPRKGPSANKLRAFMGLTPRAYRKLLVGLTNVVETQMCDKEFSAIEYSKVPSVASARYQKAFGRNDPEGYSTYLASIEKGEATMKAGAVFPHDIIRSLAAGNERAASAQWTQLPDLFDGNDENILCIMDSSGSMRSPVSGQIRAIHIAIGLALYCSERSSGDFKDVFMTFSTQPALQTVHGSLAQRARQLETATWTMSTDLQAAFRLLLGVAVRDNIAPEHMPSKILIVSDMEFNSACRGETNYQAINRQYRDAGYERPDIVFWNVRARQGNMPVQVQDNGTCIVSGFSPNILKGILKGSVSPLGIVSDIVENPRYGEIVWKS